MSLRGAIASTIASAAAVAGIVFGALGFVQGQESLRAQYEANAIARGSQQPAQDSLATLPNPNSVVEAPLPAPSPSEGRVVHGPDISGMSAGIPESSVTQGSLPPASYIWGGATVLTLVFIYLFYSSDIVQRTTKSRVAAFKASRRHM